jgi:hypothetical protein
MLPWVGALALVAVVVAVGYGALATEARIWDGFVSWTPRARQLTPPVDLRQPFFSDSAVWSHSRDYPLLQPLTQGALAALGGEALGRALFPLLFLLLLSCTATASRNAGVGATGAWIVVLAVALTPMWSNPGAGAVDSGYAELFVALALTLCGGGLLVQRIGWVFAGALLLPLLKPEGGVYGLALCLVTTVFGARRLQVAAIVGTVTALLLWWPLRDRLAGAEAMPFKVSVKVAAAGVILVAAKVWLERTTPQRRRLALVASATALAILWFWTRTTFGAGHDPLAAVLHDGLERLPTRLGEIPELLLGWLQYLFFVRKYGLLFPLLLACLLLPKRVVGSCPSRPLLALVLAGLVLVCGAMLFTAADDLQHELRSRFDRLLLQWTGVGWLLVGAWLVPDRTRENPAAASSAPAVTLE